MIVKDKHLCFTKFDCEPGECLDFKDVPDFKIKKKKDGCQLERNFLAVDSFLIARW